MKPHAEKQQFNTRIPADLKRGTRIVAAALDWTVEDITEVALASLFGTKDRLILAKKERVEQAAKSLSLSFRIGESQHLAIAA